MGRIWVWSGSEKVEVSTEEAWQKFLASVPRLKSKKNQGLYCVSSEGEGSGFHLPAHLFLGYTLDEAIKRVVRESGPRPILNTDKIFGGFLGTNRD